MKKIIISSNSAWNIINFRLDLINKLQQNNFKVIVLVPFDEDVAFLKRLNLDLININLEPRNLSLLKNIYLIYQFYKIFKYVEPDFFLGYTVKPNVFGSIAASFISKIKICNNISGLGTFYFSNFFFRYFIINLYKIALRKSSLIFFQNEDDKIFFLNKKIIKFQKNQVINGSGVDINLYPYTQLPKKINSNLIFSFISRLIIDKGVMEFIEAAKIIKNKYPDVSFNIVGKLDASNSKSLNQDFFDQHLKENVFNYFKFEKNILPFIQKSDCIILPSYREGASKILLESASVGRPLIAANVPGCNNIITDNFNGYLCKVKDYNNLAHYMEKMINLSHEERSDMGKNGRKIIEDKFDINLVNSEIIMHIKNLYSI